MFRSQSLTPNLTDATLIAHRDDDFVDKVVQLYEDEPLWTTVQRAAQITSGAIVLPSRCTTSSPKSWRV